MRECKNAGMQECLPVLQHHPGARGAEGGARMSSARDSSGTDHREVEANGLSGGQTGPAATRQGMQGAREIKNSTLAIPKTRNFET
jgi:hypothetical protein